MSKQQKQLRIGVIGAGGMGQGLISSLTNKAPIERVVLAAVAEKNPKKLEAIAQTYKIPCTFTSHDTMLAKADLDAVYVATPNYLHKPHTLDALDAGCHVFCEKPVALRASDAEAMLTKAKQAHRVFMPHFPMRFSARATVLKNMIKRGEFGQIYYAKASYLRRVGVPGYGGWFTNSKMSGGGSFIDLGVHILDRNYWLMGAPEPVTVSACTFKHLIDKNTISDWPPEDTRIADKFQLPVDVEDLAMALVRFKNGATLTIEASWAGHSRVGQAFELFGTKAGSLEQGGELRIFKNDNGVPIDILPDLKAVTPSARPFASFIDCIRNGSASSITSSEVVNICAIIDAVYRSAKTGREVKL